MVSAIGIMTHVDNPWLAGLLSCEMWRFSMLLEMSGVQVGLWQNVANARNSWQGLPELPAKGKRST